MIERAYPTLMLAMMAVTLIACGPQETTSTEPLADDPPWPDVVSPPVDPETEAFVDELLSRMTVEEKVGQTIQAELRSVTPEDIRRYHLGSVLNGGGSTPGNDKRATVDDWLGKADAFYDASMDTSDGKAAIPVLWGSDAVHGHSNVYGATIFPHNIGLGAANDAELVREIGEATAIEMLVTGLDWTFAPTLAVVRDDRWGRTYEGYSEDPDIVARYASAIVEGLQGVPGTDGYLGDDKILATAKHYVGDGGTVGGRDQGDNVDTEADLARIQGAGYPPAIEAGVRSVMASFNSWHGDKLHGHEYLIDNVLKDHMGFNGFVVGDWNGHGQVEGCTNERCSASFNAGVDMFMVPEDFRALYDNTLAQVKAGEISMSRLDDAVRRILRVKKQAGLFERGRPSERLHAGNEQRLGGPDHRALARRAVRQSLVLLKNNGALLPLSPASHILVAGDGADDIGKQTGGWTLSWQGTGNSNDDFPGATSIFDGIRSAVQAGGGSVALNEEGEYEKRPDVAVVVFGEDPYAEFQGDVPNLLYENADGQELALLKRLADDGIPVVSVFLSGRPLWVNPHINASRAFVAAWLPGSEGGGIADMLFEQPDGSMPYDFTGRLSYSWPRYADQTPLNVGDKDYDPLFPYGYGLSLADDGSLAQLSEDSGLGEGEDLASGIYLRDGRAVAGFSIMTGPHLDDLATVEGLELEGSPDVVMADRAVQGDASQLHWEPREDGYFLLRADAGPLDLERESNGHLSLSLWLQVTNPPASAVRVGMRDAAGEAHHVDLAPLLDTGDEFHRYRISLRCFAEGGVDMKRLVHPLELSTTGPADIVIAEARLATQAEGESYCPN